VTFINLSTLMIVMSYNTFDQIFWFAVFGLILVALIFSLVERARLASIFIVTFLAITFVLSRIDGTINKKKEDKYEKRTNKRNKNTR
jgi:predicted aspartyl protease